MVQVSAQPSLVFLGDASRKQPGPIDELAVEGGLWIAPWSDPGDYRAGIHLSDGWLDWPEERVFYGGIGLGGMPAATPRGDAAAR